MKLELGIHFASLLIVATGYPMDSSEITKLRVVGGVAANPNSAPFIVALQLNTGNGNYTQQSYCAGAIISYEIVVTAAHCRPPTTIPIERIEVVAGRHNFAVAESTEQRRKVLQFVAHENYKGAVAPNDLAVIRVDGSFQWTTAVSAVALPFYNEPVIAQTGIIFGWGSTSATKNPVIPSVLQTATLQFISNRQCAKLLRGLPVDDTNLCTSAGGVKSACSGDSGGPVVGKRADGTYLLVGVVSWGIMPCGNYPSVHVRVASFIDWIEQQFISLAKGS